MSIFGDKLGLVYTERKSEMQKPKILKVFTVSQLMSAALKLFRNKIKGDLWYIIIAFAFTLSPCEQAFVISWGEVFYEDQPSGRNLRCCRRQSPSGRAVSSRAAVAPWLARPPAAPESPLVPSPKFLNQNQLKSVHKILKFIFTNKPHLRLLLSNSHCSLCVTDLICTLDYLLFV